MRKYLQIYFKSSEEQNCPVCGSSWKVINEHNGLYTLQCERHPTVTNMATERPHGAFEFPMYVSPSNIKIKENMNEQDKDILRILFAVLMPPVGVFLEVGLGIHFWISILLTLFGYLPGIIHAVWVIVKKQ